MMNPDVILSILMLTASSVLMWLLISKPLYEIINDHRRKRNARDWEIWHGEYVAWFEKRSLFISQRDRMVWKLDRLTGDITEKRTLEVVEDSYPDLQEIVRRRPVPRKMLLWLGRFPV
jgi:hypothetical protein